MPFLATSAKARYVKKIEKLQFQLEELMYEKDKIAYQWANAQKVGAIWRLERHNG